LERPSIGERLVIDELPNCDAKPSFEEKRNKERKRRTI